MIPALNSPADLTDYEVKPEEAKIVRPKCDVEFCKFLGLGETLGYLSFVEKKTSVF